MSKFTVPDYTIYICTGSKCCKRGGKDAYKAAKSMIKHLPGAENVELIRTECTDRCDYAPVCAIQPGNAWLKEYKTKDLLSAISAMVAKD